MSRGIQKENFYRKEILKAIRWFWEMNGYSPSVRDLAKKVGQIRFGKIASTSVITHHLNVLRDEGLILMDDNIARSIRLTSMHIYFMDYRKGDYHTSRITRMNHEI